MQANKIESNRYTVTRHNLNRVQGSSALMILLVSLSVAVHAAEKAPDVVPPYQVPTFTGENTDWHTMKPAINAAKTVNADLIVETVNRCYPVPPMNIEISLRSGAANATIEGSRLALIHQCKTEDTERLNNFILSEIDAPEISHFGSPTQPFGKDAADSLREMIKGEKVSVEVQSVDQYGRTVGNVKMGKDNINAIMVEDGLAWVYREYVTDTGLIALENAAKEKGLGLWADENPIYPADFRKTNK